MKTLAAVVALGISLAHANSEIENWYFQKGVPSTVKKILKVGKELHKSRMDLVDNAKSSIYLTTFSISNDDYGKKLANKLCKKAKEGLDVRLIIDHIRNKSFFDQSRRLEKCGAQVISFMARDAKNELDRRLWAAHEKLLITDGNRVIIGGSGYGSTYGKHDKNFDLKLLTRGFSVPTKKGWYDTDYELFGDVACEFHYKFQRNFKQLAYKDAYYDESWGPRRWDGWYTKKFLDSHHKLNDMADCDLSPIILQPDMSFFIPLYGSPYVSKKRPIADAYDEAIEFAKRSKDKHIKLYSPYLIPSDRFVNSLISAIESGVKVTIITNSPNSTDESLVKPLFYAMILQTEKLIAAGAEIRFWTRPSTIHRKGGLFTEEIAFIGSDNLDNRGQEFSSESVALTNDHSIINEMKSSFSDDLKHTEKMTQKWMDSYKKTLNWFFKWAAKKGKKYM